MEPLVHDACLTGVSYKTTSLTIDIDKGEGNIVFILDGLKEVNLCVWSGSIVSDIIILRIDDLPPIDEMFGTVWSPLFHGQLFDRDIKDAAERITARDPDSFVFVLSCSYGGTIACVVDNIAVNGLR